MTLDNIFYKKGGYDAYKLGGDISSERNLTIQLKKLTKNLRS
jgi:hypothetical protein